MSQLKAKRSEMFDSIRKPIIMLMGYLVSPCNA